MSVILGPVKMNENGYRRKTNTVLGRKDIVSVIKPQKIQRVGHIYRINPEVAMRAVTMKNIGVIHPIRI